MSSTVFSKKEEIGNGFFLTQKYIGSILLMGFIFLVVTVFISAVDTLAGKFTMSGSSDFIGVLTMEEAEELTETLTEQGYINQYGWVGDSLRYLEDPNEIQLPLSLEPKRTKIAAALDSYRYKLPFPRSIFWVFRLMLWILNTLMTIGSIKIFLSISRDKKPSISELFTNIDLFASYVLGTICYALTIIGGLILLVVPAVIFGIMFQMYSYLIADKGLGPIAALQRSREITRGSRMNLFLLGILLAGVNLLGLLCFFVGLLWSIPTTSIALASVYDKLESAGGTGNLEELVRKI